MIKRQWLCAALLVSAMVGCQAPKANEPAKSNLSSAEKVAALHQRYSAESGAALGDVVAVRPGPPINLAAVSGVNGADFKAGDVITFVDADGNTIAFGSVKQADPDLLQVQYDTGTGTGAGQRAPAVGDFAVAIKAQPATAPAK